MQITTIFNELKKKHITLKSDCKPMKEIELQLFKILPNAYGNFKIKNNKNRAQNNRKIDLLLSH